MISSTTHALEVMAPCRIALPWECLRRYVCLFCAREVVWVPNGRPCCARPVLCPSQSPHCRGTSVVFQSFCNLIFAQL